MESSQMKRRFYECSCGHTWAIRIPIEQITAPWTDCPECSLRWAPKHTQAEQAGLCDDCGADDPDVAVTVHGHLCPPGLTKPDHGGLV